jgi:rare lipoprotein A
MYKGAGAPPKGGGRRHVGKPYTVAGKKFLPAEDPDYDKTGLASWYGPKFHKRMTSNGEWFDMDYRSAAHPTLPLPSYAKVTNLENGRQMIVRINDRGPFVGTRIIDLSRKSADILGFRNKGKAKVRVQYIGPAPLDDQGTHLAAMNNELSNGAPLNRMIAAVDTSNGASGVAALAASSTQTRVKVAAGDGGYFVQVGAFSDVSNASRVRQRLQGVAPVIITPVNGEMGTVYRVRLGPIGEKQAAVQALNHAMAAGHHDARVVTTTN